jgi:Rhodopsin-like GPCR transmembrane domain
VCIAMFWKCSASRTTTTRPTMIKLQQVIQSSLIFIIVLFLVVISTVITNVEAKETSGKFRLSGLNTETILGSFAVSANKMGYMTVVFKSKEPYSLNKDLKVSLFRDDKWPSYRKAPSCTDKIPFSVGSEPVMTKKVQGHYEAEVAMQLDNLAFKETHYFYFVITDCSLEFYMHDDQIPQMSYTLKTWNDGSHVSADEMHLKTMHTVTFMISGILAVGMAMTIFMQLHQRSQVHAAMFLVMAAAASDSMSSLFELIHLSIYAKNGVGSYALDAISAYLEAICDSVVALILLSIGAGWTLPSDVIAVQQNASPIQKMLGGLQSPFTALRSFSPTSILAISVLVSHIVLAQLGRIYSDDFDSYHDLEHLPGKLLMLWRIILGFGLVACCISTRMRCPASLQAFYFQLAVVGTIWFISLPLLTWIVNTAVPYHLRHRTVGVWGAVLQTSGIVLLSWLVTAHSTSYHKLSHMSAKEDSLTDSLAGSGGTSNGSTWMFGSSKVRLD